MSRLEFQEKMPYLLEVKREIEVPKLRFFNGRIIDNMPLLLSGRDENGDIVDVGRTPMTLKQLLDERVNGNTNVHDRGLLREESVDVAFGEIVDPDGSGEIKYTLYSQPLVKELFNSLNPKSNIKNYGLVISSDQYHAIPKEECMVISPDIANDLRRDGYSHPDTRKEIWVFGAEGDESLVDGNLELVKQMIGGDLSNRMGIFPSRYAGLRSWWVVGLDGGDWSDAGGRVLLDYVGVRLVGVAPKAQSA